MARQHTHVSSLSHYEERLQWNIDIILEAACDDIEIANDVACYSTYLAYQYEQNVLAGLRPLAPLPEHYNDCPNGVEQDIILAEGKAESAAWSATCPKCVGTGLYYSESANATLGPCYACKGKGTQDDSDRRRNYGYDQYIARKTTAIVAAN